MSGHRKLTRVGVLSVLRETWSQVLAHELLTRASAIAFSSMMAAVPFLALVLTLAVHLLPNLTGSGGGVVDITPDQVEQMLRIIVPEEIAQMVSEQIANMQNQPRIGVMSITLVMLMWMASGVFVDIIDALNRIYGVQETRAWWRVRCTAIFLMLLHLIILSLCLLAVVLWPQIIAMIGVASEDALMASSLKWVIVFAVVIGSFALTFKLGPDSDERQRWVTPGSVFGTLVFLATTYGFRVYVQEFAQYDKFYGPLGGVIMLLFWFWISSLVLLVAAEMNRVVQYAVGKVKGSPTQPDADETNQPGKGTASSSVHHECKHCRCGESPEGGTDANLNLSLQANKGGAEEAAAASTERSGAEGEVQPSSERLHNVSQPQEPEPLEGKPGA